MSSIAKLMCVLLAWGVGVAHAGTREEDRNKAAAIAYYHTQNTGDWETARKYLADNYAEHHPAAPPGSGIEYVQRMYKGWSQTGPMSRHTSAVLKAVAQGDMVALFLRDWSERLDRTTAIVAFFRFDKNGKITDHWHVGQRLSDPLNNNGMF